MSHRLCDINPHVQIQEEPEGITPGNVDSLVRSSDVVLDTVDFSLREKVELYRSSRRHGKTVVTAPSAVNGAMLFVFKPDGVTFEEFFEYQDGLPAAEFGLRLLKRLIPRYPAQAPREMYQAAARGERTLPLDAVGVDQASVLAVAAIENLVLGRMSRVVTIPKCLHVDVSDPAYLGKIVDYGSDFRRGS